MKKLQLEPEHLLVESFAVQSQDAEESAMTLGVTLCLPATCPECPRTRNPVCYLTDDC
jgi:hypothetical protein